MDCEGGDSCQHRKDLKCQAPRKILLPILHFVSALSYRDCSGLHLFRTIKERHLSSLICRLSSIICQSQTWYDEFSQPILIRLMVPSDLSRTCLHQSQSERYYFSVITQQAEVLRILEDTLMKQRNFQIDVIRIAQSHRRYVFYLFHKGNSPIGSRINQM